MRAPWKRVSLVVATLAVLVVGGQALGTQPFRASRTRCSPGGCGPTDICGTTNQVPKLCGETKNGPFFGATYACCCCTADSKGRWFFGE